VRGIVEEGIIMYQIAVFTGSDAVDSGNATASTTVQQQVNAWLAQHPTITITHMASAVTTQKDILITIMYQDQSAAPTQQPTSSSGVWTNR
jgi:hypothetical protein